MCRKYRKGGIFHLKKLVDDPCRWLGMVSFVVSFAYLVVFRCTDWFNLPTPVKHANAVQLIMTLRVIGLAYEITDMGVTERRADPRFPSIDRRPSPFDAFTYLYNFCGLFTGMFSMC
jgi:lysophospholipid acyltransferase 7